MHERPVQRAVAKNAEESEVAGVSKDMYAKAKAALDKLALSGKLLPKDWKLENAPKLPSAIESIFDQGTSSSCLLDSLSCHGVCPHEGKHSRWGNLVHQCWPASQFSAQFRGSTLENDLSNFVRAEDSEECMEGTAGSGR